MHISRVAMKASEEGFKPPPTPFPAQVASPQCGMIQPFIK